MWSQVELHDQVTFLMTSQNVGDLWNVFCRWSYEQRRVEQAVTEDCYLKTSVELVDGNMKTNVLGLWYVQLHKSDINTVILYKTDKNGWPALLAGQRWWWLEYYPV